MFILKIAKKYAVFCAAILLTFLLFSAFAIDKNLIKTYSVNGFLPGGDALLHDVEVVDTGDLTSYIEGYLLDVRKTYDFYNFGLDMKGEGVYFNTSTVLIKDDTVYELPTTPLLRGELLALPQATTVAKTHDYALFAGTGSKFFNFLLPKGDYKIAFIYENFEKQRFLVQTDESWCRK